MEQSAKFLIILSETFQAAEAEDHTVAAVVAAEGPSMKCSPRITRKGNFDNYY